MEKYYWQLCLLFSILFVSDFVSAQKVSLDNIKQQCTGLPIDKRVRLSVSTFTVATPTAQGKFGDELAQMLTTALQEVNCFNVLLSLKDIQNATDELEFNQKGKVYLSANVMDAINYAYFRADKKGAAIIIIDTKNLKNFEPDEDIIADLLPAYKQDKDGNHEYQWLRNKA